MAKSDTTRLAKLQDILARLKRGETVQNRQLRIWLGERGYEAYEDAWSNNVDLRNMANSKPGDLVEYEDLLKKGIMLSNRADAASLQGKRSATKLRWKADAAFERALERLQELLEQDPSLPMWLDRDCDFTAGGNLSLDPVGMPRVITSRSPDNQRPGPLMQAQSKRQCKISAVEEEIDNILNPREVLSEEDMAEQIRALTAKLKKR